jgi:hypothetical protein
MVLRKIVTITLGLVAFAISVFCAIWTAYSFTLLGRILGATTVTGFALVSFECFRHGFRSQDHEFTLFSRGLCGVLADLVYLSIAISLMLATFHYQRRSDPFCGGDLSAGFPFAFLCDNAGESPISDWGRMSWMDIPHPLGLFLNTLFYTGLLWMILSVVMRMIHQMNRRSQFRR